MKQLVDRLQPLADRLAKDLAKLLAERVDALIGQVENAFDVALSAAAAELGRTGGADMEAAAVLPEPKPARPARAPERIARAAPVRAQPPLAAPKPTPGKVTCKKCGFVGGNARGCGTAHEPLTTAPVVESDDRDERRTSIAELARRRRGQLPTPHASFDIDHETGEVRELDFGGEA